MPEIRKSFTYGSQQVTLSTGKIAKQADAAVWVEMGDTTLLVTLVYDKNNDAEQDFFPLTVIYREPYYAAGRIPGGFLKREGKPSEYEVLISRALDRSVRPLFSKDCRREVQILVTVHSKDPAYDADLPAFIGISAALALSGLPASAVIAGAKVGYVNDEFVLNPSIEQLSNSKLDLTVAGTQQAILMVESAAKELHEDIMVDAIFFAHDALKQVIQVVNEFKDRCEVRNFVAPETAEVDTSLVNLVRSISYVQLQQCYALSDKMQRQTALRQARLHVVQTILAERASSSMTAAERSVLEHTIEQLCEALEKEIVRQQVLQQGRRVDGRDLSTVRPITIELGLLPRVHGSVLFTRGETQALVMLTLGTERDAQIIDSVSGVDKEHFMLHYNFPQYSVGELGMPGTPKRREIGHGRLARKAIESVLPDFTKFPYVLRVVSEITESNGSSSMATVCGTVLALMDAGVPIAAPVAGVAMGLVKDGDNYKILTDILGDEDHLGDMDFKVAGTHNGVTALQMDIKIAGITREIMHAALQQAKTARLHILEIMHKAIPAPRNKLPDYAPRILTLRISPDKVRDVIGKGGVTIRQLTEQTGTNIDIKDDGTIKIAATNKQAALAAKEQIELIVADPEIGRIYPGTVVKLADFGAFVNFLPGKDGLVHVSQISRERVERVDTVLSEGQAVRVKVLEIDKQGRIKLSMKEVEQAVTSE